MPTTIIWDADPIILELGPFTLRWYSLCFAAAFMVAFPIWYYMFTKAGKDITEADRLCRYLTFGVLLGARLGHVIFYQWDDYKHDLIKIFLPFTFSPKFKIIGFSGLASHGAGIGMVLVVFFYVKRMAISLSPPRIRFINRRSSQEFLWIADHLIILVALGGTFIRIGNFINSEIIGKPTNKNYGVVFVQKLRDNLFENHASMIQNLHFCKTKATNTRPLKNHYQPLQITITFKETTKDKIVHFLQGPLKKNLVGLSYADQPMHYESYGSPLSYTLTQHPTGYQAIVHTLGIPRHPTQLYESFAYLLIFIVSFGWWYKKGQTLKPGRMVGTLLVALFLFRFFNEFYKENQVAFEQTMRLNMGQWLSLPWIIAGLFLILRPVANKYQNENV